jgi:PAS domain S-box-containing protein
MILGHLILTETGTIQAANEAVTDLLGLKVEDWIGRPVQELWVAARCSSIKDTMMGLRTITAGASKEREGVLILAVTGQRDRTLGWRASRLMGGGQTGSSWLLWEEAERAGGAAQSLTSYRDTFVHAVEGIFRTTVEGRYLEANSALAKMYGFDAPAALIQALADLNTQLYVQPGRRAEFIRLVRENGYVSDFESEVYRADGSRMWIAEFARTVTDHQHQPLYFEGSVIDITKHRQAEATLRGSEERFRHLVETMNLVPWEGTLEGRRFTYVGPQAGGFLGVPGEDWLKEGFWAARLHPDDSGWVKVVQEEALAKGERFEAEYRMVRADGRVVWVRDMMAVKRSISGSSLMGFILDVTHRRSTEMALEKSRYFLDQLVSAFPVIVYLYDVASMRCLYVSGQVTGILGYSGEALSEMNPLFLLALCHPDETAGFRDHVEQLVSTDPGEAIEREIRLRSQTGDWVWLRSRESVFATSALGESQQIVGVATDITARHMAWEELVSSEALFRSLIENTNAIPFEYDFLSDRFTYIGPQAQELLGYPLHRWCQQGFWASIVHPEDAGTAVCLQIAKDQELEIGKDIQTEGRLRAKDGRYVWIGQALRCGSGEEGRRRARGFLLDITQRKDRELKQESSRLLLRQHASHIQAAREQERSSIARELHDELGQALTLCNLDVDWMRLQFASAAQRPLKSVIVRKLEDMKQMISGTSQTLRRILTNLRPPVLDELGLAAAIEWQAREFSRRAALRCEVHAELIECPNELVATAAFRIFQEALTNIARHAHATLAKVSLRRDQDQLILTVSDNGVGFDISESEDKQSFGLLGIRERAAALGGALKVFTATGKGTTITVTFPLTADVALNADLLPSAKTE